MSAARFIPYEERLYPAYFSFAEKSWGHGCYQAKKSYIDWLYRENPSAVVKGNDFLVATTTGNDVVGVVHKMRIPWNIRGNLVDVPAIHNLFVEEDHRTGTGFYLLSAIRRDESHVFSPSQTPALGQSYRSLKWQPVQTMIFQKTLRPLSAAYRLITNKLSKKNISRPFLVSQILPHTIRLGPVTATSVPRDSQISCAAASLRKRLSTYLEKPHWDDAIFRWRFFHPTGPRHILFHFENDGSLSDFLIVSVGNRHGFSTARIIDGSLSTPERLAQLIKTAEKFLAAKGAHFFLAYSADNGLLAALRSSGWRQNASRDAFIFHHDKLVQFDSYSFNASAGDFGFESIH